jgi:hypothetical protein
LGAIRLTVGAAPAGLGDFVADAPDDPSTGTMLFSGLITMTHFGRGLFSSGR